VRILAFRVAVASLVLVAPSTSAPRQAPSITPEELRNLVYKLAAPEMDGRGSGSAGGERAGDFVADRLRDAGVAPAGDAGGFFQPFTRKETRGRNVIGVVRGTDESLRSEHVVVGAHYDHCGTGNVPGAMGNRGEIHHGADDNASGTAGVLAIARAVAESPFPRSVVFALFDAEERGLYGSAHFCEHPTVPLGSVVGMVNLDMIGRSSGGYVYVGGIGTAREWDDILTPALKREAKLLGAVERGEGGLGPSDHASFCEKEIPVLFFFTNVHRDYHQPRDTADKLRYKPAAAVARVALDVVGTLAQRKERLTWEKSAGEGLPKGFAALESEVFRWASAMARRLGGQIEPGTDGSPRFADTEPAGSKAGIEKGDVVQAIARAGGKPSWTEVKTVEALRLAVERLKSGDRVVLRLRRSGKTLEVPTTIGEFPRWKRGPENEAGDLPAPPP